MLAETAQVTTSQSPYLVPAIVFGLGILVSILGNWLASRNTLKAAEKQATATVDAIKEQVKAQATEQQKQRAFDDEKATTERENAEREMWRGERQRAHAKLIGEMEAIAYRLDSFDVPLVAGKDESVSLEALDIMNNDLPNVHRALTGVRMYCGRLIADDAAEARKDLYAWLWALGMRDLRDADGTRLSSMIVVQHTYRDRFHATLQTYVSEIRIDVGVKET